MRIVIPVILVLFGCNNHDISISRGVFSEGQECFKIETSNSTYLYQIEAGGFSNIFDSQGTDWIQFHKTDSSWYPKGADSDYRGLPNMVYKSDDGGCGHPGFDKMTSEQISNNQIQSTSKSGKWQWTWTFNERYAHLNVEKTDPDHSYWFLYEGTMGGAFSPETHYWGTDISGPKYEKPDLVLGPERYDHWQTVYFGDRGYDKVFFVHQVEEDNIMDLFTYMGNSMEGNNSPDGMVVFGFGREKAAKPLLKSRQQFIIGFYDQQIKTEQEHKEIIRYIYNLYEND